MSNNDPLHPSNNLLSPRIKWKVKLRMPDLTPRWERADYFYISYLHRN